MLSARRPLFAASCLRTRRSGCLLHVSERTTLPHVRAICHKTYHWPHPLRCLLWPVQCQHLAAAFVAPAPTVAVAAREGHAADVPEPSTSLARPRLTGSVQRSGETDPCGCAQGAWGGADPAAGARAQASVRWRYGRPVAPPPPACLAVRICR
ncbi:hypothetical protein GGX14DRAFT_397991 [Mycena pura]|uniref:Uncharacterized protein n=1 Tax=Mycena pura TaxID=153505 RepID=A0AAD6V818_9AGAR|nr:hypothetical protein GGX14DRAFT_397991 [Mycena pura]